MAEKNEVAKKQEFTTGLSQWTNTITGLVSRDFEQNGVQYDEYSKQCAMNAMSAIYQLVQNTDKTDMNNLNTSNLREVVAQCASLKLNANAMPREVFFQLRSKQVGGQWVKMVEMGVEGDGNDALLRQFGNNVDTVYPVWLVKDGDDFTYPRRRGIEIKPAEWTPKGLSDKTVRVVYPVKLKDGTIDYLIAEREPVRTNLIAHIRNNLMNETFGICENRYKATDKQKAEIKAKKEKILSAFRACETVDDMLKCEYAVTPYVSAAWLVLSAVSLISSPVSTSFLFFQTAKSASYSTLISFIASRSPPLSGWFAFNNFLYWFFKSSYDLTTLKYLLIVFSFLP